MAIRYVNRWKGSPLNPTPGVDCFDFRIDGEADYAALKNANDRIAYIAKAIELTD